MRGIVRRQAARDALAASRCGSRRRGGRRVVGARRRPAAARPRRCTPNASGALGILNTAGAIDTRGHPFFAPLGANGRGCVTCHQPEDAMAFSVASVRERWEATGGQDPLFAGHRRPQLPASTGRRSRRAFAAADARAHPRRAALAAARCRGAPLPVEFTLEVVRDPTGCNTHPVTACSRRNRPFPSIVARGPLRTRST